MRRRIATAALTVVTLFGPIAGRAVAAPTPATASQLATAIARDPAVVTGASFQTGPSGANAIATNDSALATFPVHGSTYAILTSGDATLVDDSPQSNVASVSNGGGPRSEGGTDHDVTVLKIDMSVPVNRNCLSIDFRFLSEEFPEYVGSSFNDAFIAEMDSTTWTTSGSSISAPNNFAFDPEDNVISINSSGVASMTAAEASGTIYDGATDLLRASTPVIPGSHSVFLTIFDQGDSTLDSAVFLDDLVLGTTSAGACQQGATLPPPTPPPAVVECDPVTLEGTAAGEALLGGPGVDHIRGLAGRDRIDAAAGDDQVCGGDGGDYGYGRDGIDSILGGAGNDRLFGGRHGDIIDGGTGHDALMGGRGADTFQAADGTKDCILTGRGDDVVSADPGLDVVDPRGGCPAGFWL